MMKKLLLIFISVCTLQNVKSQDTLHNIKSVGVYSHMGTFTSDYLNMKEWRAQLHRNSSYNLLFMDTISDEIKPGMRGALAIEVELEKLPWIAPKVRKHRTFFVGLHTSFGNYGSVLKKYRSVVSIDSGNINNTPVYVDSVHLRTIEMVDRFSEAGISVRTIYATNSHRVMSLYTGYELAISFAFRNSFSYSSNSTDRTVISTDQGSGSGVATNDKDTEISQFSFRTPFSFHSYFSLPIGVSLNLRFRKSSVQYLSTWGQANMGFRFRATSGHSYLTQYAGFTMGARYNF